MRAENLTPNTELMLNRLRDEDTFPIEGDFEVFINKDIQEFFDDLFKETEMKKADVIQRANIDRTYGYQIINGRRVAGRDYYLRIAIAMGLDFRMTQRLLAVADSKPLHPLIKRDAAVIFALNHNYTNEETYDLMVEVNVSPLGEEDTINNTELPAKD